METQGLVSRAVQSPPGSGELGLGVGEIRILLCPSQHAQGEAAAVPGKPESLALFPVSDAIRETSSPSASSTRCVVSLWL